MTKRFKNNLTLWMHCYRNVQTIECDSPLEQYRRLAGRRDGCLTYWPLRSAGDQIAGSSTPFLCLWCGWSVSRCTVVITASIALLRESLHLFSQIIHSHIQFLQSLNRPAHIHTKTQSFRVILALVIVSSGTVHWPCDAYHTHTTQARSFLKTNKYKCKLNRILTLNLHQKISLALWRFCKSVTATNIFFFAEI